VAQNGFSADFQKLFGTVGTHPDTLSAGYDDGISLHVKKWLKTALQK